MSRKVRKTRSSSSRKRSEPAAHPCRGPVARPELGTGDRLGSRERAAGPPTLRHQCRLVEDPLSLELNRRLVGKGRLSEIFSAVNGSVGPPHFFVISSNLTTMNARTVGSVLTLHRHFHLSPLDPLARKCEGIAAGATCSVAQSERDGNRHTASVRSEKVLGLLRIHWPLFTRHSPLFSPTVRPPSYRQRLFVEHDLGEPSASAVAAAAEPATALPTRQGSTCYDMLRFPVPTEVWRA